MRVYTNLAEGGTHPVRIWRVQDEALLAGPYLWSFTSGTEGWRTFSLPAALHSSASTDYVVSVSISADGNYAELIRGFALPVVTPPLHTYVGSGVYTESMGTMPVLTWDDTIYFRDIVFVPDN